MVQDNTFNILCQKQLRNEILQQMHNSVISGHFGRKKTKGKTLQLFYWFEIREDIDIWITKCDQCERKKMSSRKSKAPMGAIRTGVPFACLATDILGPLPITERQNRYILVVTDKFTKLVEIIPITDITAKTTAEKLLNEVISRYDCPLSIHSDQGRNYES